MLARRSVRPCFFHREIGSTVSHSLQDVISDAQPFRNTLNVSDDPTCRRRVCSLNYKKPNLG
jgi:hypothetical protein